MSPPFGNGNGDITEAVVPYPPASFTYLGCCSYPKYSSDCGCSAACCVFWRRALAPLQTSPPALCRVTQYTETECHPVHPPQCDESSASNALECGLVCARCLQPLGGKRNTLTTCSGAAHGPGDQADQADGRIRVEVRARGRTMLPASQGRSR